MLIPYSIIGIMPLSALFILFDFIVQSPHHADTRANLTLMDIVSGHFSQLEHVSAGSLPGNHLSEFAHIARRYVQEMPTPPADTRPSTAQVNPALGVTPADASLATIAAGDTVSTARGVCDWVKKILRLFSDRSADFPKPSNVLQHGWRDIHGEQHEF